MPIACFNLFRPKPQVILTTDFLSLHIKYIKKSCRSILLPSQIQPFYTTFTATSLVQESPGYSNSFPPGLLGSTPLANVYFNRAVRVSLLKSMSLLCSKHCTGFHFIQNKNQSLHDNLQGSNNLLSPVSL